MGKKLAIIGHPTRGNEVIKLLEMMGGKGSESFHCSDLNRFYYISHECICWDYIGPDEINEYEIFTLEEFLEKYPFKVGDKVVYTKFGDNCDDYPVTIESMKCTGTTIKYTFNDCVTCLAKDLRMWNGEPEEPDKAKAPNLKGEDYSSKRFGYKIPDGYEFDKIENGKIFLKPIKPKYPKTYEECCKVLDYCGDYFLTTYDSNGNPSTISNIFNSVNALIKLLVCRNTYWKIAGEQMGLGKPWESENPSRHYVFSIENFGGKIQKNATVTRMLNRILVFPTEEMRDVFYENFKDLIEQCKELL